jgi:glycerol uptake facilitator-like aquaporin
LADFRRLRQRGDRSGISPGRHWEVVMTMMFLFIIMGATHGKAPAGFALLAIGLALVMIHLVSIPVTNTSVNPVLWRKRHKIPGGA